MQRIVLLGASNLTRGFQTIVSLCCSHHDYNPLHIYSAMGHGRSYGNWSRLFSRKLPGILQSGLWDALNESQESDENRKTVALLTDIGNDLLYGSSPKELSAWVCRCVEKLQDQNANIVLVLPPIQSIESTSAWRFFLFRQLFFPKATKSLSQLSAEVDELNSLLRDLAKSHSLILKEPKKDWYGFDPIHIRRSFRAEAWQIQLDPILPGIRPNEIPSASISDSSRFRKAIRPQQTKYKRRFGKNDREVRIPQPCFDTENLKISVF